MEKRYIIGLLITIVFIFLAKYWTESKSLIVGDRAPDFSYVDLTGTPQALSDYSGKYLLIDFWGSWCQPCRESNENLVQLMRQIDSSDLQIISIGVERHQSQWEQAIQKDSLFWVQHTSSFQMFKGDLVKKYRVDKTPTYFLLDTDRRIIARSGTLQKINDILSRKGIAN